MLGSSSSIRRESLADDHCCLCLQTFRDSFLVCHNVSNTVLYEVVGAIQEKWAPGIQGVSVGVASVIQVRLLRDLAFTPNCHRDCIYYSWTSMFRITCRHLSTGFAQDLLI